MDGLVTVLRLTVALADGEPVAPVAESLTRPWLVVPETDHVPAEPKLAGDPFKVAVLVLIPAGIPLDPAVPGVQVPLAESQYNSSMDWMVLALGAVN